MKFTNSYFQRAFQIKNDIGLYLASNAVVWIAFLILGGIPLLVAIALRAVQNPAVASRLLENPSNLQAIGLNENLLFVVIMLQFVIGFLSVWFVARVIHKRSLLSMFSGATSFRWNRFFAGFGLWIGLMALYSIVMWLINPDIYTNTFDLNKFLLFLPFALILVPIQSSFEELAFRGLIMQTSLRILPRVPWFAILIQGILFGVIHSANPEVEKYGFLVMMAHYVSFGLILGIFATLDEGAEISMGIHSGNNLFAFVFISYQGIALPSPSVLQQKQIAPEVELMAVLVMAVVAMMILLRKKLPMFKELTAPGKPEQA